MEASWEGVAETVEDLLKQKKYSEVKRIVGALHDSTNSFITLQRTLGIDRVTRLKQHEDFTVVKYTAWLKENVPSQYIGRVICPNCTNQIKEAGSDREQPIFEYYPFVDFVEGCVEFKESPKLTIRVECPFCGDIVEFNA